MYPSLNLPKKPKIPRWKGIQPRSFSKFPRAYIYLTSFPLVSVFPIFSLLTEEKQYFFPSGVLFFLCSTFDLVLNVDTHSPLQVIMPLQIWRAKGTTSCCGLRVYVCCEAQSTQAGVDSTQTLDLEIGRGVKLCDA